jgi:hypothetical protein
MALTLLLALLGGCATYSNSFSGIEQQLSQRKYDEALAAIDKRPDGKEGQTDRVLNLLDTGMVQRMKGDYAKSNDTLEAAKQEMERLYTESVSEHAASFLVNDSTVSYAGEDYEQVLVHLYMAFNYLELGQRDDARVEALQVDLKLREIGEKYSGGSYTEDGFSRYLAGMIYDELGEWSDALISYRKAFEAYKKNEAKFGVPVPDALKRDLIRLAQRQGLRDELASYRKEFNLPADKDVKAAPGTPLSTDGELVFILNDGLAPIKQEKTSQTWGVASANQPPIMVTIALPYYGPPRINLVTAAQVRVADKAAKTEMVENIDAIARSTLAARMPAITARTVARAISKGVLQNTADHAVRGKKNEDALVQLLLSLFVRVAAVATEHADTRSWLTLPANIQMARMGLAPGQYDLQIDLLGAGGTTLRTVTLPQVRIQPGRKTYVTQHALP